jgi:hypothetical protein
VLALNFIPGNGPLPQFTGTGTECGGIFAEIGSVTTNARGSFTGPIITPAGEIFVFPRGTAISQANLIFNEAGIGCSRTQFTTGFSIP